MKSKPINIEWKQCHNCRCNSWRANGYIKIYERADWRRRVRLQIQENLGQLPECIAVWG